jgi:hypothetical protein
MNEYEWRPYIPRVGASSGSMVCHPHVWRSDKVSAREVRVGRVAGGRDAQNREQELNGSKQTQETIFGGSLADTTQLNLLRYEYLR